MTSLVRYSVQEVRRLMLALLWRTAAPLEKVLSWSRWRRHHQAIAMRCHYRARGARLKVQL